MSVLYLAQRPVKLAPAGENTMGKVVGKVPSVLGASPRQSIGTALIGADPASGAGECSRRGLMRSALIAGMLGALAPNSFAGMTANNRHDAPVKLITLLHRKPGMSRAAFVERYETIHSKIGEKYLKDFAIRYLRRYTRAAASASVPEAALPADVVMEIWFPNQETFIACMTSLSTAEAQAEIVADEEQMFDRGRMVSFLVEEYESDLTNSNS